MKLVNIASLDPAITETGRAGLKKASRLDRDLWAGLTESWSDVAGEAAIEYEALAAREGLTPIEADRITATELPGAREAFALAIATERQALVKVRISQVRFRRWVLASYGGKCCVTGLQEPRLLIASHIVPWSDSPANRMNPRNGLCLSPLYDRAFDQGLITITPGSLKIRVSQQLRDATADSYAQRTLVALDGVAIRPPERFLPDDELLAWHQKRFS